MLTTLLVSLAVALQGAPAKPASKPSTKPLPIAAAPIDESGPVAEVPASLARLPGPDTIAVLFMPSAERAERTIDRLRETTGPLGSDMPLPAAPVKRMLKDAIRTDLEIPLDQPVLWWIEKPQVGEDEPGMGVGNFTMHQALRIPGATAAQEKARAEAQAAADGEKRRPAMPVRAARRATSVTVLADDIVVLSSDMEPFTAPTDTQPSALLRNLPRAVVCGRLDLGRVLAEEGDQLKMLGSFATMSLSGEQGDESKMTADQRRLADMHRAFAEGVGEQLNHAIDALMQLKRATFALELQGDEVSAWADWSRDAAFPAGLPDAKARALAERLPGGMPVYLGLSSNAIDTIYGERVSIDDAIATLGATPEARKAWADACTRTRAAVGMIEDGLVAGLQVSEADASLISAFRVKDAKAFRAAIREVATAYAQSGIAAAKVEEAGDTLRVELAPNEQRMRDIMAAIAGDAAITPEALQRALQPSTLAFAFKGNEVLLTRGSAEKPATDAATADLRTSLGAGAWGTADWFASIELRQALGRMAAEAPASAAAEVETLRKGKPVGLHVWQGVKGATTRLSIKANLAELRALATDVAAIEAKAKASFAGNAAGKGGGKPDADDDDDDDEDEHKKK